MATAAIEESLLDEAQFNALLARAEAHHSALILTDAEVFAMADYLRDLVRRNPRAIICIAPPNGEKESAFSLMDSVSCEAQRRATMQIKTSFYGRFGNCGCLDTKD
jgi:hypothetical protein